MDMHNGRKSRKLAGLGAYWLGLLVILLLSTTVWAQSTTPQNWQGDSFTYKPKTYGQLGGVITGRSVYCSDCNANTNPCTAGGTGAWVFGLNGAWVCSAAGMNPAPIPKIPTLQNFGAVCAMPGGTDSTTAVQNAVNATTTMGYLWVDPCPTLGGTQQCYNLSSLITYSIHSQGHIHMTGAGTMSAFCINNVTGGFQFADTAPPLNKVGFELDHINLIPQATGAIPYGIDVQYAALSNVHDIYTNATGYPGHFTIGVLGEAMQQSNIDRVRSYANTTGIQLQDLGTQGSCQDTLDSDYASAGANGISLQGSSGIDKISRSSTQSNSVAGILMNQTLGACGYAPVTCDTCEVEANTTNGIYIQSGGMVINNALVTAPSTNFSIRVDAGGWFSISNSVINNPFKIFGIPAGQLDWIYNNVINGTFTNVAPASQVVTMENRGTAAPADSVVNIFQGMKGVGGPPQLLSAYGACNAASEGLSGTQTDSTAACAAGTIATSAGGFHCQIYCNKVNWIQTGR